MCASFSIGLIDCIATIISAFCGIITIWVTIRINKTVKSIKNNARREDAVLIVSSLKTFEAYLTHLSRGFDNGIRPSHLESLSNECDVLRKCIDSHLVSFSDETFDKCVGFQQILNSMIDDINECGFDPESSSEDIVNQFFRRYPINGLIKDIREILKLIRNSPVS